MKYFLALSVCAHMAAAVLWYESLLPLQGTPHTTMQVSLLVQTAEHPAKERIPTSPIPAPEAARTASAKQKDSPAARPGHDRRTTRNSGTTSIQPVSEITGTSTARSTSIKRPSTDSLNIAVKSSLQETDRLTAKSPATGQQGMILEYQDKISTRLQQLLSANFVYPPLARRRGWEGDVLLGVRLEANGRMSSVRVVQSSGYPVLDHSALRSAEETEGTPEIIEWLAGRHSNIVLPVHFRLIDS